MRYFFHVIIVITTPRSVKTFSAILDILLILVINIFDHKSQNSFSLNLKLYLYGDFCKWFFTDWFISFVPFLH